MRRRRFLHHAARLTASGLAAAAISDRLVPEGLAQGTRKASGRRPQRVAVIGADHYHATSTPNYLRILQNEHVDIVGVHAPDAAVAAKWAGEYGSTPYTDYRVMIEKTKPEFVVALGRHVAMPAEFRFLVETGIPFLMEKPWGIDDKTVNELADLAEAKQAWAAVPMPFRYSLFAETAVDMRQQVSSGRFRTYCSDSINPEFNATWTWEVRGCCRRPTPVVGRSSISGSMGSTCFATSRRRSRRSYLP